MKILAGIVTYNPQIERLNENIEAISCQVNKVVVVDNGSSNIEDIRKVCVNKGVELIVHAENLGIAVALNQILKYAYKFQYEWYLTLDQDSVVRNDLIEKYMRYVGVDKVAILTCLWEDRNRRNQFYVDEECTYVEGCITSGSLNNTTIIKNVGGYCDELFIDVVDIELARRVIECNFTILRVNKVGLLHELGCASQKKFLNKEITIHNEPIIRDYYIFRNLVYLYRIKHDVIYRDLYMRDLVKVILFENDKWKKVKMIVRGTKDGLCGKMGKYSE